MSGKAMRLKEKIRILSRKKDMSAQVVLQNYMFERFLERLSNSTYKDKFILKGGMLIAALVGIANRATAEHRKTTHIFNNINNRVDEISESEALKKRWTKYTKDYRYASDITYMDIMNALRNLCEL